MKPAFSIPIRVYYEDTDAGGVVYYANYLKFLERARTEWLRSFGFEQDELSRNPGVVFAVRSVTIEFLKPARFNESIEVTASVRKFGGASLVFDQRIVRGGDTLCQAEVKIACLNAESFSPVPLPESIQMKMEAVANA